MGEFNGVGLWLLCGGCSFVRNLDCTLSMLSLEHLMKAHSYTCRHSCAHFEEKVGGESEANRALAPLMHYVVESKKNRRLLHSSAKTAVRYNSGVL